MLANLTDNWIHKNSKNRISYVKSNKLCNCFYKNELSEVVLALSVIFVPTDTLRTKSEDQSLVDAWDNIMCTCASLAWPDSKLSVRGKESGALP